MVDYLFFLEKSSAMESFATALGGNSGTIDGKSYQLACEAGHLLQTPSHPEAMVEDQDQDQFRSWQPEDIPWDLAKIKWRKEIIPSKRRYIDNLRKLSQDAKCIVIATDDDATDEGEMIAWEAIDYIHWHGKVMRCFFGDLETPTIQKAVRNLTPLTKSSEDGAYLKAWVRDRWDYCSMAETRLSTTYTQQAGYYSGPVNQGRLKSYILDLIYQRLQAIENYVRTPYYEVEYQDDQGHWYTRKVNTKDEEALAKLRHPDQAAAQTELTQYGPGTVANVKRTLKHQAPQQLLNMSMIDGILAKQGYTDSTLIKEVYQKLYDNKYLSYPRTDEKFVTTEQFKTMLATKDQVAQVVGVDPGLLTHTTPRPALVKEAASHGANHYGSNIPESLEQLARKMAALVKKDQAGKYAQAIYSLVVRTSLTLFGEDYEFEHVTAEIKEHPEFKTSFNLPKALNYKLILNHEEPSKDDQANDVGQRAQPSVVEGANPKPSQPTKEWIFKQLEKAKIGTPATQQSTVAEMSNAKGKTHLLKMNKDKIKFTERGQISALMCQGTFIANPKITKQLFDGMDQVKQFKKDPERVLATVNQVITHDKPVFELNAAQLHQVLGDPKPKNHGRKPKEKVAINWQGKTIQINRSWGSKTFTDEELKALINGETISFEYKGQPISGKLAEQTYQGKKYVGFLRNQPKKGD
ncbi:DNA topoisomerase [Limosilactobacillus gastricus]|uniref:DNA topoisomerase n=1 Tax=Limosilactobacillus gastricus TaxID=227942 RepID=UPI0026F085B8|nr:DNA topoisomerase [Limosilactobacillus gastricus]